MLSLLISCAADHVPSCLRVNSSTCWAAAFVLTSWVAMAMVSASASDVASFASSWGFAAFLAFVALRLAVHDCSARLATSASRALRAASSFALAAWGFDSLSVAGWRLAAFSVAAASFFWEFKNELNATTALLQLRL